MSDNVRHPTHYTDHCSIECIDMIKLVLGDEGFAKFCLGNAMKYLWRWKFKNGREDIEKANVYTDWLREFVDEHFISDMARNHDIIRDMIEKAERQADEEDD